MSDVPSPLATADAPRPIVLGEGGAPNDSLASAHARIRDSYRQYAAAFGRRRFLRGGYLKEIVRRTRFYVEPGARVLEIGVGSGDLLAALEARRAVGIDLSPEMLEIARRRWPELTLHEMPAESVGELEGPFDYIVFSDVTVFLHDIARVLRIVLPLTHPRTRLVFNFHSRVWQPLLWLLARLGLPPPHPRMNWVTAEDLQNLLELAGYEVVKRDTGTLLPVAIPGLAWLANRVLYRLPVFRLGCLVNWIVARPRGRWANEADLAVTVVVPCRNEAGHIAEIVRRVPAMGRRTELIFVEGHSRDDTWDRVQDAVAHPGRTDLAVSAMRQTGKGKGDAVRMGFAQATGDVLMILDADLTVPPESCPEFLRVLASGDAEFVNGSRLVYPMDDEAMRFLNILGNKFFARVFSALLDQPIKDTLCGTKVLARTDYERLARGRHYFGGLDPFGDFDLLFGASKLSLRIRELPVRYAARRYGETNIRRFRDGFLLLRMSLLALRRLKLV